MFFAHLIYIHHPFNIYYFVWYYYMPLGIILHYVFCIWCFYAKAPIQFIAKPCFYASVYRIRIFYRTKMSFMPTFVRTQKWFE